MIKSKHRNKIVSFLLCLLVSPIFLIPIIMMVLGSFKTQGEALHMDPEIAGALYDRKLSACVRDR